MRALALMNAMLEQILQLVRGKAEVGGHLPELPVGKFGPVVVGEDRCAVPPHEDRVRPALAQLPEVPLLRSPDLSSLVCHLNADLARGIRGVQAGGPRY